MGLGAVSVIIIDWVVDGGREGVRDGEREGEGRVERKREGERGRERGGEGGRERERGGGGDAAIRSLVIPMSFKCNLHHTSKWPRQHCRHHHPQQQQEHA